MYIQFILCFSFEKLEKLPSFSCFCSQQCVQLLTQRNSVTREVCFSRSIEALVFVFRLVGYVFETGKTFDETVDKKRKGELR